MRRASVQDRPGSGFDLSTFEIGSKLRILPNHACATGAMFDHYYVTDGSTEVVDIWHRKTDGNKGYGFSLMT